MDSRLLIAFVVGSAVAAALTPAARAIALGRGFVDRPTGWKTHVTPTPYLGGAAVLAGFGVGSLLAPDLTTAGVLLGIASILALVGTVDDAIYVDIRLRLLVEFAAGSALWAADLGWQLDVPNAANLALTCAWVVTVVNAFNILDLMDTLATSVLIAAAAGLAVLAGLEAPTTAAVMSIALVGAAASFLPFNIRPARLFLGDGGTMALGFIVAALIILSVDGAQHDSALLFAAPLLFLVPLIDAVWRAGRRMKAGVSLMTAGNDSVANAVQRLGMTTGRVGLVFAAAQAICSGGAIVLIRSGEITTAIAGVSVAFLILVSVLAVSSAPLLRRVGTLLSRE